jgi:hypothetical protein
MSRAPLEAIALLADFTPILDAGRAIVDRHALDEVLAYLRPVEPLCPRCGRGLQNEIHLFGCKS